MSRYALHIEALKLDGKYTEMPRVNYAESRPYAKLDPNEVDAVRKFDLLLKNLKIIFE
jgi:hypothetical protein